ncbi:hypothetical protein [Agrobacterium sp. S2/73]|uniref:hypothetical protein n=1 Tax=Agrobacterium sp. S2/73 TaxID=2820001 RepID=UPI0032AF5268
MAIAALGGVGSAAVNNPVIVEHNALACVQIKDICHMLANRQAGDIAVTVQLDDSLAGRKPTVKAVLR